MLRDHSIGSTYASYARVEPMYSLEDYRIECQKKIEYAVDEGHVDADSQYDGFCEQKSQRA